MSDAATENTQLLEENLQLKKQIAKLQEEQERISRRLNSRFDRFELTSREEAEIKTIFYANDTDNSGVIDIDVLQRLYYHLGEALTDAEAEQEKRNIRTSTPGRMTFDEFLRYWKDVHQQEERYGSQFKVTRTSVGAIPAPSHIETEEHGEKGTLEYRVFFKYNGQSISPWHDVPLRVPDTDLLNFVCEIPRFTRAKFEVATGEVGNPIRQDTKNAMLRSYTWGDIPFNYGMMPQTWEDPAHITPGTGRKGDNDPIDCLEIGVKQRKLGEVVPVKILGVLALIDSGETDWKVLAIGADDPLASRLNDIEDVAREMPGAIEAVREFFRVYKVVEGKELNDFGFEGKAMPRKFALDVIDETHQFWLKLQRERGQAAGAASLRCTPMLPLNALSRQLPQTN